MNNSSKHYLVITTVKPRRHFRMRAFQQKKATKRGPFAMINGHRSNIGVVPLFSLFTRPAKVRDEDPVAFGFIERMDHIYTHIKPLKMLSVNWGKHLNKEVVYL